MRCLYLNVPTSWDDWESQTEFAYFQTTFLPFQDVTYLYAYNQAVPPKRKYPHNVRFFPVRMDENRYRNAATVPWEILDALHDLSDRPVDFIVTHRPTIVPALRLWMESVCKVATPIVVVDSFVPHAQRSVQPPKKDAYYRLTAQGYALADACIAQCEYEYDLMLDTAYRYGMSDIRDKTFCLESKLVLPKNGGIESKTKSVLYGQKLTKAQRGGNEVLSTLQKLSYVRPDCQIYVTSQKRNTMKIVGKNVIEATNLSRAYYRELIKRVMVGFTMSKDEGFPKGLVEQILSDVVVFVPKAQWALQLFKDDYPFYYVNEDDLVKRMSYVLDHYEECASQLQPFKERVVSRMSQSVWDVVLSVIPDEYMETVTFYLSDRLHKFPEEMTFNQFLDLADVRPLIGGYNGFNTYQLYHAIKRYGYTDHTTPEGELVLRKAKPASAEPSQPS